MNGAPAPRTGAPPDGYTLVHVLTSHAINPTLHSKLPYDTLRDFACVTQIGSFSSALIAHPSFPAKNIKELIALAKAQPGKSCLPLDPWARPITSSASR